VRAQLFKRVLHKFKSKWGTEQRRKDNTKVDNNGEYDEKESILMSSNMQCPIQGASTGIHER